MKVLATLVLIFASLVLAIGCGSDSDADEAQAGRTILEFTGRIDQVGLQFTFYGYVTNVSGIDGSVLFTSASTHDESTARLTLHAQGQLTGRSNLENIFSLDVAGDLSFYVRDSGGAKFTDPSSFTGGSKVGTNPVQIHNIITVIAPNQGLSNGAGEISFPDGQSITVGGKSYALTAKGTRARIEMTGSGTRLEPVEPRATILVSGDIISVR